MTKAAGSKDVLREVDDTARRLARTLIRCARFGALGVLDPESGAPAVSRVSLATDGIGAPVFLISQLSGHFGALEADGRASLLVGQPGKGDPLAHPRITVTGTARKLSGSSRDAARTRFLARHPKAALYADFADFAFWRLEPEGASLNGGFGKAYAMTAEDLASPAMDDLAIPDPDEEPPAGLLATALLNEPEGPWRITGCDAEGVDLANTDRIARLWFDRPLSAPSDLQPTLAQLAARARGMT